MSCTSSILHQQSKGKRLKSIIYSQSVGSSTKVIQEVKDTFEYPIISGRNAFILDFIRQLLDTTVIKRELKKVEEDSSSDEEGGSIFDAFMGGGKPKTKEKKKPENEVKIEVDKPMLLSIISDYYSDKGFALLGLVLAYENKEIKMSKASSNTLAKNIIVEVVKGTRSDNQDSSEKVTNAINELVNRLSLDKEEYYIFVRNQYRFLENLRLEFRFIKSDKTSSTLLFRLEEELLKSIDFINVMTSYPFAIDLENDQNSLRSILSLIEYLENVVECMFIYETESADEKISENVEEESYEENPFREPSNSLRLPHNSSEETKRFSKTKDNRIQVRSTISMKKPGQNIGNQNTQYMAELCCKLRTSFLLYVSMILLAYLIKKFEYIRPLLHDMRVMLYYKGSQGDSKKSESSDKGEDK